MQIVFQLPLDHGVARDELPEYIHFVVHLASWRMELHHELELRQKVCTVKAAMAGLPGADACTFAIGRLNLHDVIGLHASPASKIWSLADTAKGSAFATTPKVESGRPALGSPRDARPIPMMPTLVVHVPSNLNPHFHDARICFGARTMSWLHQLMSHVDGRQLDGLKGPRVIVPLHLQAQPKLAPPHHRVAPTATSAPASPRRAHALVVADVTKPTQWSEGELAFPLHGATAREREPDDGWRWRSITSQPAVPPPSRIPMCQVPKAYEYYPGRIDDLFAPPPSDEYPSSAAEDDAAAEDASASRCASSRDASAGEVITGEASCKREASSRATTPATSQSLSPRHHRLSDQQQRALSRVHLHHEERPKASSRQSDGEAATDASPTRTGGNGDENSWSSLMEEWAWCPVQHVEVSS